LADRVTAPVTKVEFGFTQSGGSYVYNDITSYVRSVDIQRGLQRNLDTFTAGQASVVLNNLGREFDPYYLTPTTTRINLVKNPIPSTSAPVSPQETWSVINRGTGGAGTTTLTSLGAFDTVTTAASTVAYSFGITGGTTAARIAVTAGQTYSISFYATSSVSDTRRLGATFYNSAGTSLGDVAVGVAQTMLAGYETRFVGTYTAPASAVSMRIYAGNVTGSIIRPLGSTMYWRNALVEQTSSVGEFFTGATTNAANTTNSWTGTAQASTSQQIVIPSLYGAEVKTQASVRISSANSVIFTGWIDQWNFDYTPGGDSVASFVALDAIGKLTATELNGFTPTSQLSNLRFTNVLDRSEVAWSASARNVDPGAITLDTTAVEAGTPAWQYLQQIAASEGGATYVDASGNVTLRTQIDQSNNNTQITYRYNKCVMPSFESATLTTADASWTIGSRSSTYAKYGTYSATQATYTDPADPADAFTATGQMYYDSEASKWQSNVPYTISIWVFQPDVNDQTVWLYAGSGIRGVEALRDVVVSSDTIRSPDGWVRFSVTIVPSRANKPLCVWIATTSASLYVDALLIEPAITLDEYFDAANVPADTALIDYTGSWDGVSNLSSSTLQIATTYEPDAPNAIYFDDTGTNVKFQAVELVYGSEKNNNRVQIISAAGSAIVQNASAIAQYGTRTYTQGDNLASTTAQGTAVAYYYLDAMSEPELRFNSVTTQLEDLNTTQQAEVLAGEIWSAARVTYTPSGIGSSFTALQRIIGISHQITPATHAVTFNLGSYGSRFVLDSAILGVLDSSRLSSP
jgi:hypothetical protein